MAATKMNKEGMSLWCG